MLEVERLKELAGDAYGDTEIAFALEAAENLILGYCHIERIPRGLQTTAYRMALDMLKNEGAGEGSPGPVSAITEGDVSVSFGGAGVSAYHASILKSYEAQMRPYRKLVFKHDTDY